MMLSGTLKCVIAQTLCQRKGGGRVAAFEILYVHSAVGNLIREKKTFQLPSVIQTGKKYGMCSMNESLMELVEDGLVELEEAYAKSTDKQDMNQRVNEHLLEEVEYGDLTPLGAIQQSYYRPGMVDKLKQAGYDKAVQEIDMSQFADEKSATA